jgi:DNA repair protein RadD
MYKLFNFQESRLSSVIDYFDHGGKATLLQAPTGTGKSLVACEFIRRMREQSRPIYFVTHSKSLLWQFSNHLTELEMNHGIIAPGAPILSYRIQVISAASLMRRINQIDEPWGLIFEEAHHSTTEIFSRILKSWPNARLLGLTATPYRLSGEPLSMYDHLITSPSVRWFIDNAYLSDFDYYIPSEVNTEGIHHVGGDFIASELAERLKSDKSRVGNLVQYYEKYAKNLPGIAFGTSIADAEEIGERFRSAGYDMKALHSKTEGDIQVYLQNARDGLLSMISTCDMIGEGVDVKGLTVEIDARPTESLVVKLQHSGRVLRAQYAKDYDLSTLDGRKAAIQAGGKGKAQILDFSSNYLRHGLPDDEREWSLEGAPKLKNTSAYKRCPDCQRPVSRILMKCPYCGYEFPRMAEVSREPEEVEGSLIPIGSMDYRDKNSLIIKIARQANDLRQAIYIAKHNGADHRAAWYIWTQVLKKPIEHEKIS